MVKYTEDNKNMRARLMLSDGHWAVMAIVSQEIHDKMDVRDQASAIGSRALS